MRGEVFWPCKSTYPGGIIRPEPQGNLNCSTYLLSAYRVHGWPNAEGHPQTKKMLSLFLTYKKTSWAFELKTQGIQEREPSPKHACTDLLNWKTGDLHSPSPEQPYDHAGIQKRCGVCDKVVPLSHAYKQTLPLHPGGHKFQSPCPSSYLHNCLYTLFSVLWLYSCFNYYGILWDSKLYLGLQNSDCFVSLS